MKFPTIVLALLAVGFGCKSGEKSEQVAVAAPAPPSAQPGSPADDTTRARDPRLAKADLARISGNPNAKTWLIVISDFQCPYCRSWHDSASATIRRDYVETGKIRLAYVNYPLGQHQHALPTAEAAMCAGVENKFWEYHDALFATQKRWAGLQDATSVLDSLARAVGVDVAAHKECRDKHVMLPLIAGDRDRASASGAESTPTFLVGGRVLKGVYPLPILRQILDAAVAADKAR